MEYKNCDILLFGQDEKLNYELQELGFAVHSLPNSQHYLGLRDILSQTDAKFFLTVSVTDHFSSQDILHVANSLLSSPETVYSGERKMPEKKSLPQTIYGFLSGLETADVTTSLYGASRELFEILSSLKGKEGSFFQSIPLVARAKGFLVKTVPLSSIVSDQPGWNILLSTVRLYQVFIKFSIAAFIAYLVDIGTFYLFQKLFSGFEDEFKILIATVLSRILCSAATYLLNRGAVFNSAAKSSGTVIRFIILAVGQLIASWLLVWGIGSLLGGGDEVNTILKVVVDLVIFLASFTLQRDWVFKESKGLLK